MAFYSYETLVLVVISMSVHPFFLNKRIRTEGSNPTQSTEFSVQIPRMKTRIVNSQNKTTDNQIFKPPSCLHSTINYGMRDLYHRKE